MNLKIPTSFNLFASTINVEFDNRLMNEKGMFGESVYSEQKITLSHTDGLRKLPEDLIINTFYHEKVHLILDAMHERELSQNEQFVDVFAKLLRQSDETAEFENVKK